MLCVCQGAGFEVVMASVGRAYRTDKELMEQHTRLRMVNHPSTTKRESTGQRSN
jgi:hypothetical protein